MPSCLTPSLTAKVRRTIMLNRRTILSAILGAPFAALPAVVAGGAKLTGKVPLVDDPHITLKSFRAMLEDQSLRTIWITMPFNLANFEHDSLDVINVVLLERKHLGDPMYLAVPSIVVHDDGRTFSSAYHNITDPAAWKEKIAEGPKSWPSYPVRFAVLDEIEKLPASTEGSIFDLAHARTASYPDGKVIVFSSRAPGDIPNMKHIRLT